MTDGRELIAGAAVKEMQNPAKSAENRLDIRLIGAFSVTGADGTPRPVAGRKDRAVLAFLATHRGRPIARERLVEMIWPGGAEGAGRASLRQSLSAIRKALAGAEVFAVDRDTVTLLPDAAETDIGRLENAAPDAFPDGSVPLTNGEAFLDDLGGISAEFDTWRATEQSRIGVLARNLVDKAARRAETEGDARALVAALAQLVTLDPLDEAAQRRYMRSLIASGQPNAAIRQYHRLETQLRDELDVEPDSATREILAETTSGAAAGARPSPPAPTPDTPERAPPTIIIHQFRDLSPGRDDDHFAEGLSDSISAALSHIAGLNVIARQPVSDAGGREVFELHGTVRRDGTRVRVGARLLGQATGQVLWAEDYDRELVDIFAVQDDITHRVTVEMRVKLSEGEKIRVLAKHTRNVEVWTRLMRADVLTNTLVEADSIEARRLLEECVEIDPGCAAAWGELADTYLAEYMMGRRSLPKEETLDRALHAAEKALEAEPDFIHAFNTIGFVQMSRGAFEKASNTSRKAMAAAPRNPEIAANAAYALLFSGHVEDALQIIRRAIDETPIPPMWYVTVLGLCHYMQDDFSDAIDRLKEAAALVPESAFARAYLVGALMEAGAVEEAGKVVAEIRRLEPDFALSTWPGADFADARLAVRLKESLARAGINR